MSAPSQRSLEGTPIFDNLDIDLIMKVLANTMFSPFFVFFIPVFYIFQGAKLTDPVIILSSIYYVAISLFWFAKWTSRLYRNQGSILFGPGPLDWGEQIVVVTGGSSGVGELLANTLAVRNVSVVVLDIKPIQTENYNISYYKCDVSNWEEVEAVSKKVIEEIGQPTILVNNAGVVQGKLILDLTPQDIKQTYGVNALAHYWILKAFLPGMLEKKTGHIVNVSSILGLHGTAYMTDYNATKAALISLHESLRYELDKCYKCPKIRTTLVMPGHIMTPLFSTIRFPQNPLFKFFMPSVQPVTIVKRIIQALDEQHSQTILVPFYAHLMLALRLMPSFIQDFAHWIAAADSAMGHFTKVSGRREDEGLLSNSAEKKHN